MAHGQDGPTGLVLLHGSELGGWVWQRVLPRLRHPALAVDLPGRGEPAERRRRVRLDAHVAHVVDEVQRWPDADRVVLVLHSASGVLAPGVAAALGPRLAAVVFVAATVPEPGRAWVDLQPRVVRLITRVVYRLRPGGALSPRGETVKLLCADLDEQATALVLARRVPEPPGLLLDRVRGGELPVPVHVVTPTDDLALTPQAAARGAARLSSPVLHETPGGHLPMLGAPDALAALLDAIADDPSAAGERTAARS